MQKPLLPGFHPLLRALPEFLTLLELFSSAHRRALFHALFTPGVLAFQSIPPLPARLFLYLYNKSHAFHELGHSFRVLCPFCRGLIGSPLPFWTSSRTTAL